MKKILTGILALCMTAVMLTSCSDNETSSVSTTESKNTVSSNVENESSEAESSEIEVEPTVKAAPDTDIGQALTNYENASFRFSEGMNFSDFAAPLAANNYTDDESQIKLSIETLGEVPMLKVETLDKGEDGKYKAAKIKFLMNKLFEGQESKLADIYTVRIDVVTKAVGTATKDDGEEALVPGYFGGRVVTQTIADDGSYTWNELYDFSESEWEKEWKSCELVIRPGVKPETVYAVSSKEQYLTIMKWAIPNDACFYIADIKFEDENGNVIPCSIGN